MKLTPAKVTMFMLLAVAALIGLYIVKGLFAVEKRPARSPFVNIPLATADLAPGTRISRDHIGFGPYPEKELKQDMLRSERVIVGRVVKTAIKAGDPLRGIELYEPGENAPLVVEEGKKALSLEVQKSADMVEGLIKPGNYVDVHFVLNNERGAVDSRIARLGGVSMTLLKGVKVLAMNRTLRQGPVLTNGNSVTLELTPAQTNILLVAEGKGDLTLSYNPAGLGDGGVALNNADRATLWDILGLKKPTPPKDPPEPEKPFEVEAFRGTGGSVSLWDKNGKKWSGNVGAGRGAAAYSYNNGYQSARDWPAGSGGTGGGWGGDNWWGGQSYSDPYNYNRYNYLHRNDQGWGGGYFDPSDVFESPGSSGGSDATPGPGASNDREPSAHRVQADSDIPATSPGVNPIRPLRNTPRMSAQEPTLLRR